MQKIRLGNDIKIKWSLLNSEGEPYSLEGADLRITYTTFRGVTEVTDFSVSGNVVSWTFKGKDQKILGDYIVTLQQNAGEDNMLTVDKCDAFRLVARSCDAGGETACSHLQIETVDITSTLDVQQIATGGTAKWNEIEGKPENFADWNAEEGDEKFIANKPTIPSKTSELQNDSDFVTKNEIPETSTFITNTVDNLVNYYLKSETYTKQEVVALINQITTINFKVVDELPGSGESNLIYLVKKEGSGDDVHDEYIWVEGKWEKIGSTTVDLTNYYTKTDADGRFALKTSIADMLTKTEAASTYQPKGKYLTEESDPTVPSWAKQPTKPTYTAKEVGALPAETEIPDPSSFATKEELKEKADKIKAEDAGSGIVTKELQPNVLYKFGECTNLNITLAASDNSADEYMFTFDSGTTPTSITLPDTVIKDEDDVIEANKHYEVSIRDNYLSMKYWNKA